jgi:hypothetical protein
MEAKRYIFWFFLLSSAIGFMQVLAIKHNLFYEISWLDSVLHFFGGIWVTSGIFVILFFIKKNIVKQPMLFYVSLLFSTLVIGIVWELTELYYGLVYAEKLMYAVDTSSDIAFDLIGATMTSVFIQSLYGKEHV